MRLFESDNIWKRRKRAQARANAPDTPERRREEARQAMTSQFLWLFGAVLLDVLGLAGLKLGVIAPDVVTVGFLIVLAAYALISIRPAMEAYRHWKSLLSPKSRPRLPARAAFCRFPVAPGRKAGIILLEPFGGLCPLTKDREEPPMCMEIRDNTLYFDGCDTTALAQTYGTPLYVYSQTALEGHFRALHEQFLDKWENTRAAYAAKAFCTPALLRLVKDAGLCVDVVSGGELTCALSAGFPAERVEFNGNNKLPAELELAVERGVGRIIIDGLQELALLESICARHGKKMKVLYRVTPGVRADTHDYIITGKKDSKFGIPLDDDILYPAIKAAIDSPCVDLLGLPFQVGSQLVEVRP